MTGVHDSAMNHVMQQSQMTSETTNRDLPTSFTASNVAAMMEHIQLLPFILTNPWAVTLITLNWWLLWPMRSSFDPEQILLAFSGSKFSVVDCHGGSNWIQPHSPSMSSNICLSSLSYKTESLRCPSIPKLTCTGLNCNSEEEKGCLPRED